MGDYLYQQCSPLPLRFRRDLRQASGFSERIRPARSESLMKWDTNARFEGILSIQLQVFVKNF